jgi:3-oxoacyl-[acyl-carrier protein] reductase
LGLERGYNVDLGLHNQVAIVSASSKGLGKAVALSLAQEGARVAICARNEKDLKAAEKEIHEKTGVELLAIQADVTKEEDIKRTVETVVNQWGQIDILVNNTGGSKPGEFADLEIEDWDNSYQLLLRSVVLMTREVVPHMRRRKRGRIINITSISVEEPIPRLILSNSLRTGVIGLAKTLAVELGPDNILVNNVAPGRILTDRVYQLDETRARYEGRNLEEVQKDNVSSLPLRRYGDPEEFASMVTFLASERSSYITGATIPIEGGLLRKMVGH